MTGSTASVAARSCRWSSGPIRRGVPVELGPAEFLRAATDRSTKVTVPGPFTLSQLAQNEHYPDQRTLALAYAEAINEELADLVAAGIDVVQLDEPYLQANAEAARQFAVEADRPCARRDRRDHGAAHLLRLRRVRHRQAGGYPFLAELADCAADQIAVEFAQPRLDPAVLAPLAAKTIVLGVLDLSTNEVEPPGLIVDRLRAVLDVVPPERLVAAPDCGMKFLPRARRLRQAAGDGRGRGDGACRTGWLNVPAVGAGDRDLKRGSGRVARAWSSRRLESPARAAWRSQLSHIMRSRQGDRANGLAG